MSIARFHFTEDLSVLIDENGINVYEDDATDPTAIFALDELVDEVLESVTVSRDMDEVIAESHIEEMEQLRDSLEAAAKKITAMLNKSK